MESTDRRSWGVMRRILIAALSLMVMGAMSYAIWRAFRFPRGDGFLTLLQEALKRTSPDERAIGNAMLDNYREYRANAVRWSGTYHTCLFASAALGALSALVLKLEFFLKNVELKKDLAALAATLSALLITFSTVGDFQGHWQANRLASGRMESLGYEFATAERKDLVYFTSKIREISMDRDREIVGDHAGPIPPAKRQ